MCHIYGWVVADARKRVGAHVRVEGLVVTTRIGVIVVAVVVCWGANTKRATLSLAVCVGCGV